MTSSLTDENILDHNFLANLQHDDQDILDEFLDQRVYDSIGTNTPVSGANVKLEQTDLLDSFYHPTSIPVSTEVSQHPSRNVSVSQLNHGFDPSSNLMKSDSLLTNNANDMNNINNINNGNTTVNNMNNNNNLENSNEDYLYMDQINYTTTTNNSMFTNQENTNSSKNDHSPSSVSHQHFTLPLPAGANDYDANKRGSAASNHLNGELLNGSSQIKSTTQLAEYEFLRDEVSKLKFGNHFMNPCPPTVDVPDASYLDFSPEAMSKLPYTLQLFNLPHYSRVETQIKLKFSLSPPPPHTLLHIPQDLLSKNKFCLNESINDLSPRIKESLLYLDAYVLTSDLKSSCNICSRCIKREQKRASRRKAGFNSDMGENVEVSTTYNSPVSLTTAAGVVKNNPNSWADDKMMKKAVIFNCKEIVSFPPPTGLMNDLDKSLELSARIICYCRHHKESEGFKLLFVVKNQEGVVVAKHLSTPIMIMDRKKNTASSSIRNDGSVPNSVANSSTNLQALNDSYESRPQFKKKKSHSDSDGEQKSSINSLHPLSPNSIDESASEPQTNTDTNTEGRGLKRKKLSIDDSFNSSTNPMFNGSVNGFSPLSNSDTNTSTTNHNLMVKTQTPSITNGFGLSPLTQAQNQSQSSQQNLPSIQRIIPAQGPIRGGIEVTLLGFNFRPGLQVKFGANQALATHCWSETTIVTYLPPAAQPGQVLVSFEDQESMMLGGPQHQQIFTYTDDTDRQLIELALQIVGLKMNGKLEDAKNIAKRIVGTDNNASNYSTNAANSPTGTTQNMNRANIEWFDSAHKAVQQLTKSDLSTEQILISFLSLVDLPNCPIIIPNWQLSNKQGQSLLHLATLKKYTHLIKFLITHGCKIDLQDNQGITPLFLASMCGHRDLINIFVDCKSNWNLKLSNDKFLKDYCDLNVLDIFNNLEAEHSDEFDNLEEVKDDDKLNKSISLDSLNSMFTMNYGRHVSKMVLQDEPEASSSIVRENDIYSVGKELLSPPHSPPIEDTNSEFADSEFESNDDEDDYNDVEYEDDYYDDEEEDEEETRSNYSSDNDGDIDDNESLTSNSTIVPGSSDDTTVTSTPPGLWQKVKNVFNNDEEENLPSYDDLFPFGPSSFSSKPKTQIERSLNGTTSSAVGSSSKVSGVDSDQQDDAGISSDSSEDIVISYINHPRKTVENDKMLLFFWFPVLVGIVGLFFMISVMGYRFETIENIKLIIRTTVGQWMVGNERIGRVFRNNGESVVQATGRLLNV
ncbi:hypothetical protein G9P44_002524 [Scheffersomyces stipitis]|nr:hypothetical protein G9P44_002524 [Scheffersomyces stipitis]